MEPQHLGSIDGGQTLNVAHVLLHSLAQRDSVAVVEAKWGIKHPFTEPHLQKEKNGKEIQCSEEFFFVIEIKK